MNCQDIVRILDDMDITGMSAREREAVEAHLVACADCAADWKNHHRLVAGFAPPLPAGLKDRARAMVVASASRSARSRAILFGTVLVVAAAAATLGLWLREPAATTAVAEPAAQVPPAVASGVTVTAPQETAAAVPAAPSENAAALPPGSFTVRVPPLDSAVDSAEANALAQRFRDRVIERLAMVPGLVLADPKSAQVSAAQYEVRISLPHASATMVIAQVDATTSAGFAASDAIEKELARLDPADQAARRFALEREGRLRPAVSRASASPNLMLLLGSGFPRSAILKETLPAVMAGNMPDRLENSVGTLVRDLRTKVFPLNAGLERELLGIVSDYSRKFGDRARAFGGLLSMAERRGGYSRVDAAVIHATADFAISSTTTNNQLVPQELDALWEGLAATKHPELLPHLIHALDVVPTTTRLQIIKILARDFGSDPRTQLELEAVAQRNSEAVVRMAALRESRDESKWRDYVVATLGDATMTDVQRLQPIADMIPDTAALTKGNAKSPVQLDHDAVRELGALIMKVAKDFRTAELARNSLTVLTTMENPAARDVFIEVLRSRSNDTSMLRVAAATLAFQQYAGDADVRAALEELANSTAADGFLAKTALQVFDRRGATEKSSQPSPQQP